MNMLVKRVKGKEYFITDFMATRLSKKKFEALKEVNQDKLGEWEFVPFSETDFTWWDRCFKKLTPSAIRRAEFRITWDGKVEEW